MNITNIASQTGQTNSNEGPGGPKNQSLGKNDFLQLLVTQMKNQDPMNPADGTEFAAQLAQFNSVEQLVNVNDGIKSLANSQKMLNSGLSNSMAASLTGKHVRALSDKVGLQGGEASEIDFKLNNAATEAEITISDSAGNVVRSEEIGPLAKGSHSWTWDGKSDLGHKVSDGTYSVAINAKNEDEAVQSLTFTEGIAEKVHYSENGVELLVNGTYIPLGDVEEIGIASS